MTQLHIVQLVVKDNDGLKTLDDNTILKIETFLNKIPNVGFKEQPKSNILKKRNVRIDSHRLPI
jgi:hypothetical protein